MLTRPMHTRLPQHVNSRLRVNCRAIAEPVKSRGLEDIWLNDIKFEPFYRVILLYSEWNSDMDKTVAQKVKSAVPIIDAASAKKVVKQCRLQGKSIVTTVVKDEAILHASNLRNKGLKCMLDEA